MTDQDRSARLRDIRERASKGAIKWHDVDFLLSEIDARDELIRELEKDGKREIRRLYKALRYATTALFNCADKFGYVYPRAFEWSWEAAKKADMAVRATRARNALEGK